MSKKTGTGTKTIAFTLFFLIALSVNCFPQNNLEYYLKAAKDNNPSVKENFALADKAGLEEKRIRAQYKGPQAYLTGDVFYPPMIGNKNDPGAIGYDVAITDGGLYSLLMNVRQPVFTGYINEAMIQKERLTGESNKEKAGYSLHQLEKDVTERYILAYQCLIRIEFADKLRLHLENQKQILEKLAKQGIYKSTDVLLMDIQIQDQNTEINNLKAVYLRNIALLNDLCGINTEAPPSLAAPGIKLNPEVNESRFREKFRLDSLLEVSSLRVQNLKYKPQVNFYGNVGINAIELPGIQRKAGMGIGLSLIVPIYDGHQKDLNARESEINLKIIDNYRQDFFIRKSNRQKAVAADLQLIEEKIAMINNKMRNYEKLIDLFSAQLTSGETDIINYMNIIKSYISAKNDLTLSETNRLLIINESNYYNW